MIHDPADGWPHGKSCPSFDPDRVPAGSIRPLLIEMTHDGLGRPINVPLLVARGTRPGPVFGLTAAVHGNELNGIAVLQRLFEQVDPQKLRGTLAGVMVVNVPSFLNQVRRFKEGRDLNTLFPGKPDGNEAQVYVHRFLHRVVKRFDRLIDLHTASVGRVNSLYIRADMSCRDTARMAYLMRPEIILHNPPSDHTLRGTAGESGIPAITVEIADPQQFQPRYVRSCLAGIRAVLADAGMLPRRQFAAGTEPTICASSSWLYTDRGGLLQVLPRLTERVKKDEVIARLRNVFGTIVREYRAPADAIVIGRSVNPVGQTGARIAHLGVLAKPGQFMPRAGSVPSPLTLASARATLRPRSAKADSASKPDAAPKPRTAAGKKAGAKAAAKAVTKAVTKAHGRDRGPRSRRGEGDE